jgi:hypothetical protein
LHVHPNHALTYAVALQTMQDPAYVGVSYGLASLIANEGLHRYKLEVGFDFQERGAVFQFHPNIVPWLDNALARTVAYGLYRARPADKRLEYVHSVVTGAHSSRHPTPDPGIATDIRAAS